MGLNTKLQTDIAFKKLANASISTPDKAASQELISTNIQANANTIFGEDIPPVSNLSSVALFDTASNANDIDTVQYVRFSLVALETSIYDADASGFGSTTAGAFDEVESSGASTTHSFALRFPSDYETQGGSVFGNSQNPKAGSGLFLNNAYLTGSNGSVQYGVGNSPTLGYMPVVRDAAGNELPGGFTGNTQEFYLDTFAGVLFRQDGNDTNEPAFVDAYVYIGKYVSESLAGSVQVPTLQSVTDEGSTTTNQIQITGSNSDAEILIVSGGISNFTNSQISGSIISGSALHITNNSTDNVIIDNNVDIGGSLTVDGNVTLGDNNASDTVTINASTTIGGDLTVNGTTTTISATDLVISDKFIVIASGSTSAQDTGLIASYDSHITSGSAFYYDATLRAWAIDDRKADHLNDTATHDAHVATIQVVGQSPTEASQTVPKIGIADAGGEDGGGAITDAAYGQMFVDTTDNEGGLYIYLPGNQG